MFPQGACFEVFSPILIFSASASASMIAAAVLPVMAQWSLF
jgi:hypothetical protein